MPRVHGLQTQRKGKIRNRTGVGPVIIKPQSKELLNFEPGPQPSSGLASSRSAHRDSVHHLEQYVDTICKDVRNPIEQSTTEKVRRAAEWLRNLVSDPAAAESLRKRVTNGLSNLLIHLDGADINTLDGSTSKQLNCLQDSPTKPMTKRRRRLPTNNVLRALHESEDADDPGCPSDELQLTNSELLSQRSRSSTLKVSLKDVLNSNFHRNGMRPNIVAEQQFEVITTLSLEAVLVRRDLFTYLIIMLLEEVRRTSLPTVRKMIDSEATSSQLVGRIAREAVHLNLRRSWSPSTRLLAVMTLDALRQYDLSDWGYQALLAELLAVNQSANANVADRVESIKYYAEILVECSAFESPVRLFGAISMLMKRAVWCLDRSLLRAISYIMLKRHNVISSSTRSRSPSKVESSSLTSAIKNYKHFCQRLSMHKLCDWVSADMSSTTREKTVAVLQAEGILTMFLDDESDSDCRSGQVDVDDDYPYPKRLSLRSAHSRLGPMENMNRLLSHRNAYMGASMEEETTNVCLAGASEDILNDILSFLGFRSLSRSSCVCKTWHKAGDSNSLWADLYFSRWRKATYNEELIQSVTEADPYFAGFLTLETPEQRAAFGASHGYNFRLLFKQKYLHLKTKNIKASQCCHIVGCLYKYKRTGAKFHRDSHEKSLSMVTRKVQKHRKRQAAVALLQSRLGVIGKEVGSTPTKHGSSAKSVKSPEDVLKTLIFPWLDLTDFTKPVCKLWQRLAADSQLWKAQYSRRFSYPRKLFLLESDIDSPDWKELFARKNRAYTRNMRIGSIGDGGHTCILCPVPNCDVICGSKIDYDHHLLGHEEDYLLHCMKARNMRGRKRKCIP